MAQVGAFEAKTHLPALLERVAQGETITITRHGKPVARLVPVEPDLNMTAHDAVQEMLEFGRGRSLGGLSVRDLMLS
jgi:prevent-host-death family protein